MIKNHEATTISHRTLACFDSPFPKPHGSLILWKSVQQSPALSQNSSQKHSALWTKSSMPQLLFLPAQQCNGPPYCLWSQQCTGPPSSFWIQVLLAKVNRIKVIAVASAKDECFMYSIALKNRVLTRTARVGRLEQNLCACLIVGGWAMSRRKFQMLALCLAACQRHAKIVFLQLTESLCAAWVESKWKGVDRATKLYINKANFQSKDHSLFL